ncbi:hypothetical protein [Microterricola viridarii]|uniref:DUF3168 domain-containing protein n=1 Tax=Microterricola viridarii TaxID=412690 RepID=A0A0X8E3E5_9MICO|nr:hypothetical protein [Microterricola viridarii]AMB58241.1 hypothetical protein AWU67_04560 [Microterricola viridarii]
MPTPRLDQATEYLDAIKAAMLAADLPDVLVTLDALKIPSAARHGVIVITPPAIEFPSYTQAEIDWELGLVAGPATDLERAWRQLDAMLDALTTAQLPLERADPGSLPQQGGPALPAYTVTLATLTTNI